MDPKLMHRLQQLLARHTWFESHGKSEEGEAQMTALKLQELLSEHNLSIEDLETRGHKPKPGVEKEAHDLGKAAFIWKLTLAREMAEHYYCHAIINHYRKTVSFVGRPDNVASFKLLYQWVIDQIRRIASDERRKHIEETSEHIDPLRWQVHFGEGAAERLGERLRAKARERDEAGSKVTALALSHRSEISDWLEAHGEYRIDGRETARERKRREQEEALARLKETDIEAYYRKCPWDRPETPEEKAERERQEAEDAKREARNARRRKGSTRERRIDWEKEEQGATAARAGRKAGDRINLQPFIEKTAPEPRGSLRG